MKYLDPSSWMTLSDFLLLPDASTSAASIGLSIDQVFDVLRVSGMVHSNLPGQRRVGTVTIRYHVLRNVVNSWWPKLFGK